MALSQSKQFMGVFSAGKIHCLRRLGKEGFPDFPWACLKNHSRHLHPPLSAIFAPNSGYIARYAPFICHKSPTKWRIHLSESIFQARSSRSWQLVCRTLPCLRVKGPSGIFVRIRSQNHFCPYSKPESFSFIPKDRIVSSLKSLFPQQSLPNQKQNHQRQKIRHINPNPSRNFQSISCIGFFLVVLKSPAQAGYAEQKIAQRTYRQNKIADQKIFQIQNRTAVP